MFNDLLVYNIKRKDWMQVKSPAGPAPRSSHQVCTIKKDLGADAFVGLLMWRTHAHWGYLRKCKNKMMPFIVPLIITWCFKDLQRGLHLTKKLRIWPWYSIIFRLFSPHNLEASFGSSVGNLRALANPSFTIIEIFGCSILPPKGGKRSWPPLEHHRLQEVAIEWFCWRSIWWFLEDSMTTCRSASISMMSTCSAWKRGVGGKWQRLEQPQAPDQDAVWLPFKTAESWCTVAFVRRKK